MRSLEFPLHALVWDLLLFSHFSTAFSPTCHDIRNCHPHPSKLAASSPTVLEGPTISIRAVGYRGITKEEYDVIQSIVESSLEEGIGLSIPCNTTTLLADDDDAEIPGTAMGTLGRVALFYTNLDSESTEAIAGLVSQKVDTLLYSDPPTLLQPVIVEITNPNFDGQPANPDPDQVESSLSALIDGMVESYGLTTPVHKGSAPDTVLEGTSLIPTLNVEIDGAEISDQYSGQTWWDTSRVLVFDGLVDDNLRKSLLGVVLGPSAGAWDDTEKGPDPDRWIRGGLRDVPVEETDEEDLFDDGPCWGLTDDVIEDMCFKDHAAVQKFESILTELFPQFHVCRLPEAVFGDSVSPLTANAPTYGDQFDFHIDGDPMLAPPSPWTDAFGRYPNRHAGKPRFVSCLIYLNDAWDPEWGAPTRFLDPPTGKSYDVYPKPGRCVFMDQDVSHTVVAPNSSAGKRPRYSMVWKLILHPTSPYQNMDNFANARPWPTPTSFGSANKDASK